MPFIEALGQFSYRVGEDLQIHYDACNLRLPAASKQY